MLYLLLTVFVLAREIRGSDEGKTLWNITQAFNKLRTKIWQNFLDYECTPLEEKSCSDLCYKELAECSLHAQYRNIL